MKENDMKDEALRLALEALERGETELRWKAITAIKQALEQPEPEPEPVANYCRECLTYNGHHEGCSHYTSPPKREWHGLTEEDLVNCDEAELKQARYWEAQLKEKNSA